MSAQVKLSGRYATHGLVSICHLTHSHRDLEVSQPLLGLPNIASQVVGSDGPVIQRLRAILDDPDDELGPGVGLKDAEKSFTTRLVDVGAIEPKLKKVG